MSHVNHERIRYDDAPRKDTLSPDIERKLRQLERTRRSYRRLKIAVIVFLSLLVIAGISAGGILYARRPTSPIPNTISKQVDFPLIYPAQLPSGFTLDKTSFSVTNKIVTYVVKYDNDKKLIFNIQARPKNFDFDSFESKGKKLNSSLGDAYAGALGQNTVVSLATPKTWLLIGVPSSIDTPSLQAVLQHLKPTTQ